MTKKRNGIKYLNILQSATLLYYTILTVHIGATIFLKDHSYNTLDIFTTNILGTFDECIDVYFEHEPKTNEVIVLSKVQAHILNIAGVRNLLFENF